MLNPKKVPGVSLHQEKQLSTEAGIPAAAVLPMSTRNVAVVLFVGPLTGLAAAELVTV